MNTREYPKSIAKIDIPATRMVMEGSWGARAVGSHASTMELYFNPGRAGSGFIEWYIEGLDQVHHIGLSWDNDKNLIDYDGTFSLPKEAITFLESQGFKVGAEFRT